MLSPYSIFPSVTTSGLSMIIATAWAVAVLGCWCCLCSLWWHQSSRATCSKMLPKVAAHPMHAHMHPCMQSMNASTNPCMSLLPSTSSFHSSLSPLFFPSLPSHVKCSSLFLTRVFFNLIGINQSQSYYLLWLSLILTSAWDHYPFKKSQFLPHTPCYVLNTGHRMIVIATNVAETSITIPGIR